LFKKLKYVRVLFLLYLDISKILGCIINKNALLSLEVMRKFLQKKFGNVSVVLLGNDKNFLNQIDIDEMVIDFFKFKISYKI
jgi:hypothetical protein